MELRDAVQRIALESPSYGRPRITAELRRRAGWSTPNAYTGSCTRITCCVRKRKFVVTTDSAHGRKIYPNLAHNMALTGMGQLWGADITYIRLLVEFVFLAVSSPGRLLKACDRLGARPHTGERSHYIAALKMALSRGAVRRGLVHHSDRGTQHASSDCVCTVLPHDGKPRATTRTSTTTRFLV